MPLRVPLSGFLDEEILCMPLPARASEPEDDDGLPFDVTDDAEEVEENFPGWEAAFPDSAGAAGIS